MLLLMFLNEEELEYMLRELYERICGSHTTETTFALKALRNGYFWPTMKVDALDLVKKCEKCQRHTYMLRKPFIEQLLLRVVWSFDQWGINLLSPLLTTPI